MTKKNAACSLPQQVADDILHFILSRHLKPGDKLPNETVLSQSLRVGRSSVREAMKLLVSRNVVEIRQGSGTYVSGRLGVSDDPLGLVFLENSPKLIADLMEIRILLEPEMAVKAALNAGQEDICRLTRFCGETERLICSGQSYAQADVMFHQAIAYAGKNTVAPRLVPVISRTIEVAVDSAEDEDLRETVADHREIMRAIVEHDLTAAKEAMYLHLVYHRRMLVRIFKEEACAGAAEKGKNTEKMKEHGV